MIHRAAWLVAPLVFVTTMRCLAEHPRLLLADYEKKRIAIVVPDGTLEWQQPIRAIHDAQLLPDGNVLFQTSFRNVIEMTPAGKVVWKYEAQPTAAAKRVEIHAFQRLADGRTMIAESGRGRILEVDAEGKVVHEIPLKLDRPDPHRDTRLVRKLANGHYLVAHEGDKAVREYDAEGKVVWEYAAGTRVYSAVRLKSGNTLIGTGDGHSVIEVNPAGKIVWSVGENELPKVRLAWVTMVARRENGNTVIVNCHAGAANPQMLEITPDKKIVWTFRDFEQFGNALPVGRIVPAADN